MTENKLERWQQENYDKLKAAVGIDLTKSEDKTLQWLARWDHYTIRNVISIIQKLKRCAIAETAEKDISTDKRCVNYVGIACVDGSCPAAQDEFSGLKADCENCFYYKGCADCALAGTEHCEERYYHGPEE